MRLRNRHGETVDVTVAYHDDRERDSGSWVVDALAGRPRRFASRSKALAAFHEAMHEAHDEGFVLEHEGVPLSPPGETTFGSFPELEAAVDIEIDLARPVDEDALLVLGDAWATAGDPRGEALLGERILSGTVTDPAEFMRRKKSLAVSRGVCDAHVLGSLGADAYRVQVKLQRGLVFGLELHLETGAPGRTTAQLVTELLANPFARFVRELSIRDCEPDVLLAIGRSHSALRRLELFASEPGSTPLDLAALDGLPRLTQLEVGANRVTGLSRLPALQGLKLRGLYAARDIIDVDPLVTWITRHRTIETVVVQPAALTKPLETFMADAREWPAQLRKVQVGQLARSR